MAKKSKRNSGPKPGANRAAKLEQRRLEREAAVAASTRPFEGLAFECDLVALREFVPSALVDLPLTDEGRKIVGATILPGGVAALVREEDDETVAYVGLQLASGYGPDPAGELAAAIEWARTAEPGYFPRWQPFFRFAVREQVQPEQEIAPQLEDSGSWPPTSAASSSPISTPTTRAACTTSPTTRSSSRGPSSTTRRGCVDACAATQTSAGPPGFAPPAWTYRPIGSAPSPRAWR